MFNSARRLFLQGLQVHKSAAAPNPSQPGRKQRRMDPKLYQAARSGDMNFLKGIITQAPQLGLEQTTPQENTALHIAVQFEQLEFSAEILKIWPSLLHKLNKKRESPLHVAVTIGCLEITKLLVSHAQGPAKKEFLRMCNLKMETALHIAVKGGHLSVVKYLVEEDDGLLDMVNNASATPVKLALEHGFPGVTSFILEKSSEAQLKSNKNHTILHYAVWHGCQDVIRVLLEKVPDLTRQVDKIGRTPLHYAAYKGDLEATQLLLQKDSSAAYIRDIEGNSVLHIAASRSEIYILKELIRFCPDIHELTNENGHTALHVAVHFGHRTMVKHMLQMPEFMSLINEQDHEGNTALHLAIADKNDKISIFIAGHSKMEKTAKNNSWSTPFDIYAHYYSERVHSFRVEKIGYWLRGTWGLPSFQNQQERMMKEQTKALPPQEKEKTDKSKVADDGERSRQEIHLLVAALIATVTFQAAFTMPGGYKDNGTAKFEGRASFAAFVLLDALAFCFSIAVVITQLSTRSQRVRSRYAEFSNTMLFMAVYSIAFAFAYAMYLVLAPSTGLALMAFMLIGFVALVYVAVWFVDPLGAKCQIPQIQRLRRETREFLYRHGII